MERKKASLSLKTAAKNRKSKEVQLDDHERRILRDVDCLVSNEFDLDIPCTQPVSHERILEGVVAFIEVRSNTENRFEGISKQMEMLGAKVVKKFTPEVTHVIFKDGKKTTREKALKKGIHLISVLWVESCRESGKRVCEDLFPVLEPGESATPLMVGRLKRTKSMQPKAFEEDVQNSAERGERRRKRKLQTENLTPSAMILCAETQDPFTCSPMVFKPMPQPHMVPDTPCYTLDVSPCSTKTHNSDANSTEKKSIEPIKFSVDECDESSSTDDDIPSSIKKLKKRLLSKSTPTRPPSFTLTEPRTPTAQPPNTPKDELLTGSEQSKKRKRQDSTKNRHGEDITQSVPKPRKKAKVGGQTEVTSVNGVKDNENTDEQTNDTDTSRRKKTQAKKTKNIFEGNANQNVEDTELNRAVCSSGASNLKKRFSKTAKLVAHVDLRDDFGYVNASGKKDEILIEKRAKTKLGTVKKGQRLKQEECGSDEKQVNQEGVVSQGKLVCQDKLVCRENPVSREKLKYHVKGCPEEEERLTHCRDHDKRKKARKSRDDSHTDKGDSETCTEEEDEKENRTATKQRTKLVKKVKPKRSIVMTSMHFNEQDIVLSVARKLGGFFIEDRVSSSTSHVITGSPRRTLNVLMAIAHGSWLVSPMWVMKSLEAGYWVDEEPYELSDAFPAAQLCRLERVSTGASYQQELLVDCPPIFVSENCSPPSDSLMTLISLCGGKVSSSVRKAGICIGSMTRRMQAVNITEQWLLDCITQHAVLPFTNYALNSPAKRRRETSPSY